MKFRHHLDLPGFLKKSSSDIESSSGENKLALLLDVGKTSLMREAEMRHPQTDVQQEKRVLSAPSGRLLKTVLTLVVKMSATAEGSLSVEVAQEEAEEDNVVAQVPFSEAKEHLRRKIRLLPRT